MSNIYKSYLLAVLC
ncbi:TPA: DUF1270 family protein, partial [Staphylococcus aureus]|nr:DUF1270 family protein [Staphylococcus aureus]HDH5113781.1 DUF1270 family protein [Staphylococcus aureus]HDI1202149.1 DUF1270 family protein [Staphylococcus aureus]HDP4414760.1 DUF1270 family protein [Staphylococcus aureus]HDP4417420.1 DUF1270 family protein [Staphylococcus aureus]